MALVSISFLPPLGVLLAADVCNLKHWINWSGIVFGVVFSIYYSTIPDAFTDLTCNPFYATYSYPLGNLYGVFYFGYIGWAFALLIISAILNRRQGETKQIHKKAIYVLVGYLSFLVPMAINIIIDYESFTGLSSIMCKYAILLAVTLLVFSFQYKKSD
jgi:hypothetical protein